jgi:hypothetical protein
MFLKRCSNLAEVTKLGVEVGCANLLIPKELVLKRELDVVGSSVAGHHGLRQVDGDGAGDPRLEPSVQANSVLAWP